MDESELARCSFNNTAYTSNNATFDSSEDRTIGIPSNGVEGGGAVAFLFASANITDSVFVDNYAQDSGGALLGGNSTDITINGCTFENNSALEFGGAIAAASMILGRNTRLTGNRAYSSGGAVSAVPYYYHIGWSKLDAQTCFPVRSSRVASEVNP